MCGMTNTTGRGEGAMNMTVGRITQLTAQTGQSATISGYPKGVTCSTGYCNCAAKDAALSAALRREEVLREALKESNCYCSPNDDDLCHRCAALSACDDGVE